MRCLVLDRVLQRLNPRRFLLGPGLAALLFFVLAAAAHIPALLIPAGAIALLIGARINHNHRSDGDAHLRVIRRYGPDSFPWPTPSTQRTSTAASLLRWAPSSSASQ